MIAKSPRTHRTRPLWPVVLRTLLAVLLLAAAGHAALWWVVGSRLEAGFAAWVEARRAEGWRVDHGPPSRGGWPLAGTLTVPDFRLRGSAGLPPGGLDWRPDAPIVLRVSPPWFDRLAIEASGGHRLGLAGGGGTVRFTAGRLDMTFPLEPDGAAPREGAVAAQRLRIETAAGPVAVRTAAVDFDLARDKTPPVTALRASAADIALPPGLPGTDRPGRSMERVGLDLLVTGAVPPPSRDPARRAAAWRERGGAVEVRTLEVHWGEATVVASADLGLDGALQPAGTGVLRITGGEALVEAASGAGLLSGVGATATRLALRSMSRTPSGGGPARAEVPLKLRDGSLSLSGFDLARIPALDWSASGAGADAPPRRSRAN